MKVQLVTPYHVSLLQRYGVTVRGNVTSVYPPLDFSSHSAVCKSLISMCNNSEVSRKNVTVRSHTK